MGSWSRWPREVAARLALEAGREGDIEACLDILGEKHGRAFAADVLASLAADVKRIKGEQ